ncbi:hypothetical protein HNQ07_000421 [Deinococcus metalli]|uniref:Uncharacterized protein n=1 Tax=Deinococcus metalli TaxID=1141878 RepID=A0A7W8NQC4_9DEIO|nr:hypothetical protein [Deinococcus metalli]MBB5374977.1 hypothetical protein [Deinococcus metalli]GHF32338.1 hypothetical protein GCM10017781_06220 [Deinococcus metalli]
MTPLRDLTPFLHGLTLNGDAMTDARAFAFMLPNAERVAGRLEDLLQCFASFAQDQAGPRLPGAHAAAVDVLTFAASGLYASLDDAQRAGQWDAWATLARVRLWAVDRCQQASTVLSADAVEALHLALATPHTLPAWAAGQVYSVEAGHLAAWGAVSHLLETAPSLEDGEAEDLTSAVLGALNHPAQVSPSPADLPFPDPLPSVPLVYTAQYVDVLPEGRVTVGMGGGEEYPATRDTGTLTPLPDGSAFLALTVEGEAVTVRLTPADARNVRSAWGLPEDGEDSGTSMSCPN